MNNDVCDYIVSLGIEVGDCYYVDRQLTIELKGKVTAKQIRKIEAHTGLFLDNIRLNYNNIEDSSCVDLMFKK